MKSASVELFESLVKNEVLVYDGAMGTNLIALELKSEDYGGKKGCSEALNLFCPQAVKSVHKSFVEAGCRVIETNTFGATKIT
ncbi:MAG: homocysteine S-methyltransferase family protein, partial [Candidatus Riflebacteria bacterium]|nr:homocysteine S-methyltransferase family protein [Candidatus Riflebacteria bacterium]